ncbi:hypothetical protein EMIT0P395_100076 [Pseudomonas sp. IT-P395]|jgi:hypothetical protein
MSAILLLAISPAEVQAPIKGSVKSSRDFTLNEKIDLLIYCFPKKRFKHN